MTPCRCERCCPENPAPTYMEAYRLECLARAVLDLPTLDARRAWLDDWRAKHGAESTQRIKDEMRRLWNSEGAAAGKGPAAAITQHAK